LSSQEGRVVVAKWKVDDRLEGMDNVVGCTIADFERWEGDPVSFDLDSTCA
jgi:hypothetical protein